MNKYFLATIIIVFLSVFGVSSCGNKQPENFEGQHYTTSQMLHLEEPTDCESYLEFVKAFYTWQLDNKHDIKAIVKKGDLKKIKDKKESQVAGVLLYWILKNESAYRSSDWFNKCTSNDEYKKLLISINTYYLNRFRELRTLKY